MSAPCGHRPAYTTAGFPAGLKVKFPCLQCPKLFVKPSTKSNRHIIINALKDCCLAGEVNNQVKGKVLEALAMSESFHYVILFRDARCQFRAVYSYNPENEKIHKLVGNGPSSIQGKMINSLYK
uniref:CKK domain-containing protein n=1 Tax=Branchiostoma floridae TaxID=7739 RepID=C3YKK9_BRAFL|eukprot:XP_002603065.1 hypothetical protein BRAFLDRAFT_63302 [Branchiostoma floridae]